MIVVVNLSVENGHFQRGRDSVSHSTKEDVRGGSRILWKGGLPGQLGFQVHEKMGWSTRPLVILAF